MWWVSKCPCTVSHQGNTVGPPISNALKAVFVVTNVVTEGVDYLGSPETNFYPGGASPFEIELLQSLLSAAAECPKSKIVASGYRFVLLFILLRAVLTDNSFPRAYSQGAALTHRAIEGLQSSVKYRIAGVVTFGNTQALRDGGQIRGFDLNKTLIIC